MESTTGAPFPPVAAFTPTSSSANIFSHVTATPWQKVAHTVGGSGHPPPLPPPPARDMKILAAADRRTPPLPPPPAARDKAAANNRDVGVVLPPSSRPPGSPAAGLEHQNPPLYFSQRAQREQERVLPYQQFQQEGYQQYQPHYQPQYQQRPQQFMSQQPLAPTFNHDHNRQPQWKDSVALHGSTIRASSVAASPLAQLERSSSLSPISNGSDDMEIVSE